MLEETHRRAEEMGTIAVQLDSVWYRKTGDGSNEAKQDLHREAVVGIENRKAHDESFPRCRGSQDAYVAVFLNSNNSAARTELTIKGGPACEKFCIPLRSKEPNTNT